MKRHYNCDFCGDEKAIYRITTLYKERIQEADETGKFDDGEIGELWCEDEKETLYCRKCADNRGLQ